MGQLQTVGRRATTVKRDDDGTLRVRYHATDVVTVYANGKIVLDTGGWATVTTKVRMNQASNQYWLGFSVYQKDYQWFVDIDGHTIEWPVERVGYRGHMGPLTIRNGHDV